VAEQRPLRIAAHVHRVGAAPFRQALGDQNAVDRPDVAARDLLLFDQRAAVLRLLLEGVGVEHRPLRGEVDERREQHEQQPEDADDRRVHETTGDPGEPVG
jgi:hypothetical protein